MVKPHAITPEIEWLAVETSRIFNLDIAGIDLLFDGDHFRVCEANSAPGFESIEQCLDVNVPREIFHFIRIRLGLFNSIKKPVEESQSISCEDKKEYNKK